MVTSPTYLEDTFLLLLELQGNISELLIRGTGHSFLESDSAAEDGLPHCSIVFITNVNVLNVDLYVFDHLRDQLGRERVR